MANVFLSQFKECKSVGYAQFPGKSLGKGIGYLCSNNGLACSAKTCPVIDHQLPPIEKAALLKKEADHPAPKPTASSKKP